MPLLQVAVRDGFGASEAPFIGKLLTYLGCEVPAQLLDMILQAIYRIIPEKEITDELIEDILMKRQVNMEPSHEEIDLTTEFVMDAFNFADQEALEKEIKTCKNDQKDWISFRQDFKAYKVTCIFKGCLAGGGCGNRKTETRKSENVKIRIWNS